MGCHYPWSSRCPLDRRVIFGGVSNDGFQWTILREVLVGMHSGGAGSQEENHIWRWVLLVWWWPLV